MIFECRAEHECSRRLRRIKRLKPGAAKQPAIDNGGAQQHAEPRRRVDAPAPNAAAEPVEVFRMLPNEQRLRLAIPALLPQVIPDIRAPVMPDERRRAEAELATGLL